MKHITKQEEHEIIKLYEEGTSQVEISKMFDRSQAGISKILYRNGIEKKYNGKPANYVGVDETFFEEINSSDKAWVIGWILSDGHINDNGYYNKLVFVSKDREVIEKIKCVMKSKHKIQTIIHDNQRYKKVFTTYALSINNKKLIDDLRKLGVNSKKSQVGIVPKMNEKYYKHFVRGIFEGDGFVRKNAQEIKIMGTKEILQNIQNKFDELGIKKPPKDIVKFHKNREYNLWTIYYYGINNISKIGKFLYENVEKEIRLERKYEIFRNKGRLLGY